MKTHLLESDRFSPRAMALLTALGKVSFQDDSAGLKEADVLFVRLGRKIDRNFLSKCCPDLKYILSPTTGHDHLDITFLAERGIELISLRGETHFLSDIPATAEHTWALLLSMMRHIDAASFHVLGGGWNRDLFIGQTIKGKKLGILGYGRVGKQVAGFALAFGMEVHVYDTLGMSFGEGVRGYDTYEEFASDIDILSIHIPMNEANTSWLNAKRLLALRQGVKIVNTSRGGIWDEEAVAQGIREGRIAAVATDVLRDELSPDELRNSSLLRCAQDGFSVLITPHIAGACIESMHATEEFVVQRLLRLVNG